MSKIDFRSGSLTGRLAGMVGATWKGIDYVRKMVIPANPNTVAQQGTRTVFKNLVTMGRRINSTILKDNIIPKPKKMSPFNKFISNNQPLIDTGVWTIEDSVIAKGSLYFPSSFAGSASKSNVNVGLTWNTQDKGESQGTDKVLATCYDVNTDEYAFDDATTRTDGQDDVGMDFDVGDRIIVWMFLTQGDTLSTDTGVLDLVAEA